jgi:hypothetical protein
MHESLVKSRRHPVGPTGLSVIFQTGGLGYDFLRTAHTCVNDKTLDIES